MIVAALRTVSKRYGDRPALERVDLELRSGEILALLGPNGAGKTTAVSLLLGLRHPDAGRAELFGQDPRKPEARTSVGLTPQEAGFPQTLRVQEIVELVRAHYRRPAPVAELLTRFGLSGLARRQAGGLSGGERRRLAVALAFAGSPEVVFLDEPTSGLDVESRRAVWAEVQRHAGEGRTALLTTHHLEEAEALATRVVFLVRGRVAAEGSPRELSERTSAPHLEEAFLALIEAAR